MTLSKRRFYWNQKLGGLEGSCSARIRYRLEACATLGRQQRLSDRHPHLTGCRRYRRCVVSQMEDRFGHRISYLRVSITDRCNERCQYCMPQELQEWLPRAEILTFDEITRLVRIASDLGVTKIRITGGEPLVRQNVLQLFSQIGKL